MKLPQLRKKRQGFTLIELLTVIAIIGILAGMLSVVVPLVKKKAAQMDAGKNCQSIATAYLAYSGGSNTARNISKEKGGTVTNWAVFLTQKQPEINNGKLWFIAADPKLDGISELPQLVIDPASKQPNSVFQSASPKSWAVVAGASRNADSQYPIMWTRGLQASGEWDKTNSPWSGEGGHVAFGGGSVSFMGDTKGDNEKGVFLDYTSKQSTVSVQAAVGSNAQIVEDK